MSTNLTQDGSTTSQKWNGGSGTLFAVGEFAGGTVKLEFSIDGGTTWTAVSSASMTAAGNVNFTLGACDLRATLSGSGESSSADPDLDVAITSTGIGNQ